MPGAARCRDLPGGRQGLPLSALSVHPKVCMCAAAASGIVALECRRTWEVCVVTSWHALLTPSKWKARAGVALITPNYMD